MKTKTEILDQMYISANDLKILIPELGIEACRTYINQVRQVMLEKRYIVPNGKTKLALTELVKKEFGWK